MKLVAYKDGHDVISKDLNDEEELGSIVGKDVAKKLMDQPIENNERELKGEAIKVGGEGMKAAYDQRIPSIARKIAKQTGAMVGKVKLKGSESGDEDNEMDTPVYPDPSEVAEMPKEDRMFVRGDPEDDGKFYVTDYDGNKISAGFDGEEEAHDERDNLFGYKQAEKTGKVGHEVWYMEINQRVRDLVAGGMRATFESEKPKATKPWWIV